MDGNRSVICLMLLLTILSARGAHEPPAGAPVFLRSSVESMPEPDEEHFAKYSMRPTFGEVFLPLRSAVESAPKASITLVSEAPQSFVRSAVEFRPTQDSFSRNEPVAEESHPYAVYVESPFQTSAKYSAFISTVADQNHPQPYRFGSPYQMIVDPSEVRHTATLDNYAITPKMSQLRLREEGKSDYSGKPKVLCYMTNWAIYRSPEAKFVPENLDTKLCSAVIYSFASLDPQTLMIREFDTWADKDHNLYRRTTALNIPVLLALGGWTDSTGDKYSRLVGDPKTRQMFASNVVAFLARNGFRGLHLDWNYPKCWQSNCGKGPADDKPNFTKLIEEIRKEFKRSHRDFQLGVAISGYKEVITEAYELDKLSPHVDYLTVMSYDYHGSWEQQTGHVSPLYSRPSDKYPQYNTDYTMQMLVKNGAAKEKIIMGIPFYGQTFTLKQSYSSIVGEGTPSSGPGLSGEYTRQPGMMAYYEICHRVRKNKWMVGRDTQRKSGPYAMSKNQWVGYEDPASVEAKARYALNSGFAGVAAWTIDLDDFQNRCCSESFPLLKSINRALGLLSTPPPERENCEHPEQPVTPPAPVMTTVSEGAIPGPGHEHTTWPTWGAGTTTTKTPTESYDEASSSTMTTHKPTTSSWWQPSTTMMSSTWWPQPTTTPSTTTKKTTTTTPRTTTTTERRTTTRKPTTTTTHRSTTKSTTTKRPRPSYPSESTTIPTPAVVMPVFSSEGSTCSPGEFRRDPINCNSYYQCDYGELRQQFCPGGLEWNDSNKLCDWPDSAKCEVSHSADILMMTAAVPTTTTHRTTTTTHRTTHASTTTTHRTTRAPTTKRTTTTARPTTTTPRPAPLLSSVSPMADGDTCQSGAYYPHADCDSFYVCVNGKLIAQQCGPELHWNTEMHSCDWAENVRCVSAKTYLRLINSKLSPDDPCDGDTHVAYPGDCNQYLRCLHGRLEASNCPPSLHWNQQIKNCDWPSNANCNQDDGIAFDPETIESGNDIERPPDYVPPSTTKRTTTKATTTTPRPTYPTDRPNLEPLSGYYKVVCYFTNWAWYRKGLGRYTPDHINTDLCTHIVYGFAVLDYSELTIRTHDSWADIDNNFYTRVSGLKDKGVKVSLALGGWNDSQGDKYSRLVRNAASRAKFVRQAVQFVEKYGFEGLDLDWEYPVCWQTECDKGHADEKEGFTELVKELSREFKPRGWLLSTAVSPSKKIIDAGYDVPTLAEHFDWIAVMTYDFHGQWDKKTGHVAPLYYHPDDDYDYFNANFSLNYWIELGAPSRKIVMGMPLYGQSFTLSDTKNHDLNAQAPGPGTAGEFTKAAGFLAYYEICDRVQTKEWNVVQDEKGRMGPYAFKGNQWVSFDDKETLARKSQLVRSLNLGGGMVWALDLDDFNNRCGQGVHPLLTTIRNILKDPPSGYEKPPEPVPEIPYDEVVTSDDSESEIVSAPAAEIQYDPNLEVEEAPVSGSTDQEQQGGTDQEQQGGTEQEQQGGTDQEQQGGTTGSNTFKVVCYFTNWAWYRQGGGKYVPEDVDPELCTHIVYGFAVLNRDSLTIKPHDSWADLDNKFYDRVVALKARGIKVTVAIGGWNDSAGDKYSRLVRDPAARARFVTHIVQFIEKYGFDGLDLDWEYPVCWQVDCTKGHEDEKEHFANLVRELSEEFKPRGLLLSSAVSPAKKVIDAGYDVPTLSNYFDWIAVMAYDYHGQWDKKTGHVAPMYAHPQDDNPTFNANFSIHYWIEQGADRKKLVMGMPMYGQSFSLAENIRHDLNAPTYGGGEAGEATRARGFLSYYEICQNIRNRGWNVVRDRRGRLGPYAYLRDQWVSFDDAPMIRHKSEFVKAMDIGGAMIWALDLDDFRNVCDCETYPLLKTINRVLRNYPGPHPRCKLEDKAEIAPEVEQMDSKPQSTTWGPPRTTTTSASTTRRPTYNPTTNLPTTIKRTTKTPTMASTTEKPTTHQSDEIDLNCHGRNFAPHHRDCNKYYFCQFGMLHENRCPDGLHWKDDHCDWPANSGCTSADEGVTLAPTTTRRPVTMKPTHQTGEKPTKKPIVSSTKPPQSKPKPPPHKPPVFDSSDSYKVVCYFTNWAWYRPGEGKYTPDDIDESLCTHIVYGFAVLNGDSLTIKTHDSWADIDNRFYERVTALREKGIRVTLAIGGWNDSLGDKYSRLVRNPQARARFVKHVIEFIEKYGFEGLDLDWEYPVCWQVDCTKGFADEKEGFTALVRELSEEFRPRGLLLSSAVSPSKMVIDAGYDVAALANYFDWIAVMTYDFHGHWDKQTGHVAPLYYMPGDTYDYFNGNFSIRYWIEKGAPPKKLVMGMPLYGQSFSLTDSTKRGLNQKSQGPGEAGQFTRAGGFLAYYEICEKVGRGGWNVVRDDEGRIGPYAFHGSQWVSYDDVEDIRRKSKFVKELNLGGGMVWALDLDDFRGRCGCGKHPLLRTLNQELRGIPGQRASDCT